jgi:thiamine biosynthesis lipoprotein
MRYYFSLLVLVAFTNCDRAPSQFKNQFVGEALGTTYSIIFIANDNLDFRKEIDSVFQVVNQSMSTYIPNSDISKINAGDSTVVVDGMFKEVFEVSTKVYQASNGYFDPTVGVLVNAWGFGPEEQIQLDSAKVDSLLQFVGWEKVKLNENGTISKSSPAIRFDFNAVAKGHAIDRLGVMLNQKRIENYLVEVGGEVLTKGSNTITQKLWTVGVDDPTQLERRGAGAVVQLKDKALASSGNYRKFRIDPETGEKFVHTINPKNGYTKNSKVLAATVITDDCATADAYATTFMAMDLQESKALLAKDDSLEAFIIYLDENDTPQNFMTTGFEQLVAY